MLSSRWVAIALPASEIEESDEQQGLMLNDQPISEPELAFLMHSSAGLGSSIQTGKGTPQVNMLSNMHLRGQGTNDLIPAFTFTSRRSGMRPKSSLKMDRRDTDLDMLRCMIGRVYRPCWEV
ncbi:unnamed protein product [Knipowitschia caucasica]